MGSAEVSVDDARDDTRLMGGTKEFVPSRSDGRVDCV